MPLPRWQNLAGWQQPNCEIEFCLATTDPNGNPTTGITRTSTTKDLITTDDKVKIYPLRVVMTPGIVTAT